MPIHVLPRLAATALALLAGVAAAGAGQSPGVPERGELRVCADPNDLPFSNEQGAGFENKIAELLGRDLAMPVHYFWFPQVIGFVRNGLNARRCDLVIGTVPGDELMATSIPYYYSTYMLVFRRDKPVSADLADPALKQLHIGVISRTPPSDLLVRHGLMANARPYLLTVDTRLESPAHQMLLDIAHGTIDAGMLWGPFAGYYIKHDKLPLAMVPLHPEPGMPPLAFHIAMGMRHREPDWQHRIDDAIRRHQQDIAAILHDYGVPLLDAQGRLVDP